MTGQRRASLALYDCDTQRSNPPLKFWGKSSELLTMTDELPSESLKRRAPCRAGGRALPLQTQAGAIMPTQPTQGARAAP
jgi:hypothetical protein